MYRTVLTWSSLSMRIRAGFSSPQLPLVLFVCPSHFLPIFPKFYKTEILFKILDGEQSISLVLQIKKILYMSSPFWRTLMHLNISKLL